MINMDLIIDEIMLNRFVKMTSPMGELEHRGLNAILRDFLMVGYLYRDEHTITLLNGGKGSDDEDYAQYLDLKASTPTKENWEDTIDESEPTN